MNESLFKNDLRIEQEIAKYLDTHLYIPPVFSECIRTPDKESQKRGCDIILSSEYFGLTAAVADEKAAIHHINNDITTFAFELSYKAKDSDKRVPGWFLDDEKTTEVYTLIWPFVKQSDIRGRFDQMTFEDISGIRYIIVNRGKIRAYLAKRGFSKQVLLDKAEEISLTNQNGRIDIGDGNEFHFYFYSSLDYAEKPVNIVIDRYVLWLLSDKKGGIIGHPFKSRVRDW